MNIYFYNRIVFMCQDKLRSHLSIILMSDRESNDHSYVSERDCHNTQKLAYKNYVFDIGWLGAITD